MVKPEGSLRQAVKSPEDKRVVTKVSRARGIEKAGSSNAAAEATFTAADSRDMKMTGHSFASEQSSTPFRGIFQHEKIRALIQSREVSTLSAASEGEMAQAVADT
jgi:hypothetical protein